MIKDGSISYSSVPSPLLFWEPEHSALNTVFIGLLTTVLSIQATAVVFDLLLGLKPSGQVSVSDLHSLLLAWSSSPLAVLNNIIRKDWITRRYYEGDIPVDTKIARNQMSIKRRVLAKLVLLLSVVNVVAVALVLEREYYVSVRESGFGGLGWGVNMDLKVAESHQITETCRQYSISTVFQDEAVVQFSSCNSFVFNNDTTFPGYGLVSVGVSRHSEIFIVVEMYGWSVTAFVLPQLFATETLFLVKHALTKRAAGILVDKGIELMAAECALGDVGSDGEEFFPPQPPPENMFEYIHSKKLPSNRASAFSQEQVQEKVARIGHTLSEYITFVDTDRLELMVEEDPNEGVTFIERTAVENIILLRRRQRTCSVAILGMACCFLVAMRIMTISFLNNDVGIAIELAVKRRLGMGIYESMLQKGKACVAYNSKFQDGERVHYGLKRFDLSTVEKFQGGTLGKAFG